ncbi:hypothetical protein ACHAXA_002182, partial [Cyclostephanos tholiformis]
MMIKASCSWTLPDLIVPQLTIDGDNYVVLDHIMPTPLIDKNIGHHAGVGQRVPSTPRDCDTDDTTATEWLEDQSTWMSYKYYRMLLSGGLHDIYDKFYSTILKGRKIMPFMHSKVRNSFLSVIGRSIHVSFSGGSAWLGYRAPSSRTHTASIKLITLYSIILTQPTSPVQSFELHGKSKINNNANMNAMNKIEDAVVDTMNSSHRANLVGTLFDNAAYHFKSQIIVKDEATVDSVIGYAEPEVLNIDGTINYNRPSAKTAKSVRTSKPKLPPKKRAKPTLSPTTKVISLPTPKATPQPSSKPTPAPSVTPSITVIVTVSATFPMQSDSSMRQLRRLLSFSYAFEDVLKSTIIQLILRTGALTFGQTLNVVNIISAIIVDQVLEVEFNIVLEEVCTQDCASQVNVTTLDDSIQSFMNNTFESGEFVMTLQNVTQAAIAAGTYANDTLLLAVEKLNTTAAIGNMTTHVTVTTNAPTSYPSRPTSLPTTTRPSSSVEASSPSVRPTAGNTASLPTTTRPHSSEESSHPTISPTAARPSTMGPHSSGGTSHPTVNSTAVRPPTTGPHSSKETSSPSVSSTAVKPSTTGPHSSGGSSHPTVSPTAARPSTTGPHWSGESSHPTVNSTAARPPTTGPHLPPSTGPNWSGETSSPTVNSTAARPPTTGPHWSGESSQPTVNSTDVRPSTMGPHWSGESSHPTVNSTSVRPPTTGPHWS